MHHTAGALLLLLLAWPATGIADDPKDKPATPAEQYQALLKEYGQAQQDFFKAYSAAADDEKRKLLREKYPDFGPKFFELAQKNPKDPVAVDALLWVANNSPSRFTGKDDSVKKALELLAKDHLDNNKIGPMCMSLAYNESDQTKAFLALVLEKSPHKEVQAEACLALAKIPLNRARYVRELKKDPATADQLTQAFSKEYVEALQKDDPEKLQAEGEKYYKLFADKYLADLPTKRALTLCSMMAYDTDKASERLLRALAEKDTRPEVKGAATYFLAKLLFHKVDDTPDLDAKEAAKLLKESEDLFELADAKYADVELEFYGKIGKQAKKELFALRNLTPGKTAPDIEAEDQDGKKFKLSDYRGKVVLLDFWSQF